LLAVVAEEQEVLELFLGELVVLVVEVLLHHHQVIHLDQI
jgi:hypothetical protein